MDLARSSVVTGVTRSTNAGSDAPETCGSGIAGENTDERNAAFADLYRAEIERQVRRARLMIGDPELAVDLVHDAFLSLYRRWNTIGDPGPYLHVSVLNACRDAARRSGRHRHMIQLYATELQSATPGVDTADDAIWAAIGDLPFRQRAAVVLRFYEHLTENEIAVALGCRPGSVGPMLTRALRKLRRNIPDPKQSA